jgi:hypothetical protein
MSQPSATGDDLAALEAALRSLQGNHTSGMDEEAAITVVITRLPSALAAAHQSNDLREQLVQALAWLDAWLEGADLGEIEHFGLKEERLMEFTRHAQSLLDGSGPDLAAPEGPTAD